MSQLLRTYDAVLDAHYHQVTLYSLFLDLWDNGVDVDHARSAVENSRRMMISTRTSLDIHMLEHGCAPLTEPPHETFRPDSSF